MRGYETPIFYSLQDAVAVISLAFAHTVFRLLQTAFTERVVFGQAPELVEEGVVIHIVDPGFVKCFCYL